jgi:hypothetical protein
VVSHKVFADLDHHALYFVVEGHAFAHMGIKCLGNILIETPLAGHGADGIVDGPAFALQ